MNCYKLFYWSDDFRVVELHREHTDRFCCSNCRILLDTFPLRGGGGESDIGRLECAIFEDESLRSFGNALRYVGNIFGIGGDVLCVFVARVEAFG